MDDHDNENRHTSSPIHYYPVLSTWYLPLVPANSWQVLLELHHQEEGPGGHQHLTLCGTT